ncbi:MAG: ATP-binding cassette domain-containing protein [Deltaproteobacteria bacterium]|nr:ATP-binding cassette domain-containing protein [Deltaproteobacteria bacterium]
MGAENSAHAVVLNGVSLTRSKKQILKGINWKIERGSNWVVLGANGSGKTTLLKVIAGYLWPTKGTVTVFGIRLFDHALIIKDGKVVAQGVTENVINHENLKEAFGLPVTIRSENGRYWLQCDLVNLP